MSQAHTGYREVSINFEALTTDTAAPVAPLDYYKAAVKKVEELESAYAANNSAVGDLTDVDVLLTGALATQVHSAVLTVDISAALYIFEYTDTFASIEEALA